MASNPYVNKVVFGNDTVIDISDSTAVASDVAQGKYFYLATGEKVQGTATGGGSGGNVWQDAQGYVHLDDEGTTPITVEPLSVTQNGTYTATTGHAYSPVTVNVSGGGGLVYETGTWTPSEDISAPTISFQNAHTEAPVFVMISDATGSYYDTTHTCQSFVYGDWEKAFGATINPSTSSSQYALYRGVYRASNATAYSNTGTIFISRISAETYVNSSRFVPSIGSGYYWRTGRTYKWIAVWAPTT